MWTGDVQSGYPTQWALNPSAYQNLPNEQVDWATLAQQWIKMKETYPVDQIPPAPPPPSIKADIEAGEAPMDMSKDEVTPNSSASTSQDGSNWGSWNNWQQWNWGWGGSGGPVSSSLPADKAGGVTPYTYTAPPAPPSYSTDTATTTFDYNHGASIPDNFDQQGYWSGGPAPFIRNKSSEWRGESRGSSSRRHSSKIQETEPDTTTILDAAKRKQLPAWIREGLEKMEREKQKKLERERQLQEREEEMTRRKQEEEEALAAGIPVKSKFETDSEESEKETEDSTPKQRRSRFDTTASNLVPPKPTITKSYSPPLQIKRKTREEIMQDVMQQVRYVLTDILMTVTNEEMQSIAEEVLADFRAKAPATQLRKTHAFTSLTGKLGLGIYDSDSEDSSADSDDEPTSKQENGGVDSDEELRERINRKRQEFARIERDIEDQVEEQEEKEREREEMTQEDEEEPPEDRVDMGQVEPKLMYPGNWVDVKTEEPKTVVESKSYEQNDTEHFTPERSYKTEKESSEEHTEDSDVNSSSESDSSSSSSSDSRYRKSKKSSKKRREKKSSKRKRKRSSSRGSDRRRSSHRKSSNRHEEKQRYERSRSRSRSHSRGQYDEYQRKRSPSYRHHSSESSHKRRHHSYSRSPDYSRGKKASHRSRD